MTALHPQTVQPFPYDLVREASDGYVVWVKASRAFVDALDGESEPLTVRVERDRRGHPFVREFVFTRHECPRLPPETREPAA